MPSETTTPEKIRLVRPAHVYSSHTDRDKAHEFLLDFSFAETKRVGTDKIYYRGYGPDPFVYCATKAEDDASTFGGVTFIIKSKADLERASKTLPAAGNRDHPSLAPKPENRKSPRRTSLHNRLKNVLINVNLSIY
jgi:hypothetical protein